MTEKPKPERDDMRDHVAPMLQRISAAIEAELAALDPSVNLTGAVAVLASNVAAQCNLINRSCCNGCSEHLQRSVITTLKSNEPPYTALLDDIAQRPQVH